MILRFWSRASSFVSVVLLLSAALLSFASTAFGHTVRANQRDFFYQSTPLTYTPGRSTPAVAETTIRHQVFFTDLEGSTAGWTTVNFRAGMPNAWNIVSGTHACTGNSWWCGQTGLAHGDGYGNGWAQTLTTAVPINISGAGASQLTFKTRHQSEFQYDMGWVIIKGGNAGARWDTLASYSGDFGNSCSNQTIGIPDSFKAVTQPITLQFLFGSDLSLSAADSTGPYTGWTLDDIAVKSGTTTNFFDDMESGPSKWITASPNPGLTWHLESAPGTSQPATCFFLSTNVWVPFQGSGFGNVPDFSDQMIMSPAMDLTGVFGPNTPTTLLRLQFDEWLNLPDENSMFWGLWITGSNDKVTWTPWQNAFGGLEFSGGFGNAQCTEGLTYDFNPYDSTRTGISPNTKYLRIGFRLRDEKAVDGCGCGGPRRLGVDTEGVYFDNIGVYYIYTISGVEEVSGVPVASKPLIRRAFPNPFNPNTTIEFSVPQSGPVRVGIFDVRGRHVATLVNRAMNSGVYQVHWDGRGTSGADVASGVYYAQIQSRGGSGSGRLVLIK